MFHHHVPNWLFADTHNRPEGTVLAVRRSLRVTDDSEQYVPVANYLAQQGLKLRSREVRDAADMVGSKVEILVFEP